MLNIKQLVDTQSVDNLNLKLKDMKLKDFNPSDFTYIDPSIFRPLVATNILEQLNITIDNSGNPCGRVLSISSMPKGEFKVANDCAFDKGKLQLEDEKRYFEVINKQISFEYSDDCLACANLENRNLVSDNMEAVREIYLRELLDAVFVGVTDSKSTNNLIPATGILNNSLFTKTAALNVTAATTADELIKLIVGFIEGHNGAIPFYYSQYRGDVLVLPQSTYTKLASTMVTGGIGLSALQIIKNAYPLMQIVPIDQSGFSVLGGKKYAAILNTSSSVLRLRVPQALTFSASFQITGFCYRIDAKYGIAGLDVAFAGAGSLAEVK